MKIKRGMNPAFYQRDKRTTADKLYNWQFWQVIAANQKGGDDGSI